MKTTFTPPLLHAFVHFYLGPDLDLRHEERRGHCLRNFFVIAEISASLPHQIKEIFRNLLA